MDFMNYQKMFPSPQQIQQQMQHQKSNGFPLMNTWSSQFQSHQQQPSMFNIPFSPMNFGNPNNTNHFQGGQHHHQQQFHQQRKHFQLPPPPLPSFQFGQISMMQPPFSTSPNGSIKDETPREIFFKTLSISLKEANKVYCGRQTTWKNPLIYKTHLCDNYSNRQYCRFGVNCWYAHGPHELRCIPESDDLPDQAFITQYLSFLGLPKQKLDQIIQHAYYTANLSSEKPSFKHSTDFPVLSKFLCSKSLPCSPDKNVHAFNNAPMVPADPINPNKFCTSYLSNGGGWDEIQSALNAIVDDDKIQANNDEKTFGSSFHLFGESFNFQQPL